MKFERPRHSEGAVAEGLIIVEPLPRKVAVSSLSVYGRFDEKGPFRSPRPREVQLLGEEDQLRQQQAGPRLDPGINFLRRGYPRACPRPSGFATVSSSPPK